MKCRFCGLSFDCGELAHLMTCDGRQGRIEALELEAPAPAPDPFTWQRARSSDPDTSWDAALPNRNTDRARAYEALARHPAGLTDYELADAIGRQQNSAGKRRGELRDLGLVCDAGITREAPSGAAAIVWRITTPAEREAMRLQRAG